jgi:histidinol-phosphatase
MKYLREIDFARHLASKAGDNALRLQISGMSAEKKADDSLITRADTSNEAMMRDLIGTHFPTDGIIGEEGGSTPGTSGRRWILDPLDGTLDYVRGGRFWSVLIALEEADDAVLGVAHCPALAETYWAVRNGGSYCNEKQLHVSSVDVISSAVFSPSGLFADALRPHSVELMDLMCQFASIRNAGGALSAGMLAAGQIDVWLKGKAAVWDIAALQVIIEEAGGRYFALDGSRSIYAGSAVACTPGLEATVRKFLRLPLPGQYWSYCLLPD